MWEDYNEEEVKRRVQERDDKKKEKEMKYQSNEKIRVMITEIMDGSTFDFQIIGDETDALEQLMKSIHSLDLDSKPSHKPERYDYVFAKFSVDNKYYRGKVISIKQVKESNKEPEIKVFFLDYGNTETLNPSSIRRIENEDYVKKVPFQAKKGKLIYVRAPTDTQEYYKEAAELFRDLVWEKELIGIISSVDKFENHYLNLGDPVNKTHINARMVKEGYGKVPESKDNEDEIYKKLKEEEKLAQTAKIGMWEHGTGPDSDEDKEDKGKGKK